MLSRTRPHTCTHHTYALSHPRAAVLSWLAVSQFNIFNSAGPTCVAPLQPHQVRDNQSRVIRVCVHCVLSCVSLIHAHSDTVCTTPTRTRSHSHHSAC